MKVQRISAATPISTVATLQKTQNQHTKDAKVTNPNVDNSSKASQIIRNYFIGSQMVNPAFTGFACSTANFKVKELEDAYTEYLAVKEKAYNDISEAEKKYLELRDKFAKDYNGYHMTYVNNNGQKVIRFSDLIDSFFNW